MNLILDKQIPLFPPSVNMYWRSNGKTRFITPKGIKFTKDMALFVKPLMTEKRLKAEIVLHYPNKRKFDIDNFTKGIFDSLVKNGFCHDDEQFDELHIKRGEVVKGGMIEIKVWELN